MARHLTGLFLALLVFGTGLPAHAAEDVPYGEGLLWRVEGPDGLPNHIFGISASRHPDVVRITDTVGQALGASSVLVLEVDSSVINVPYVRKAIIGTDDRPVRKVLGQDRFIRALNLGKRYDWFAYAYQRLNLLGYILVFSVSASEFNRAMSGEPTVDEVLQKRAETLGIPVTYMEAFDELLARILEEGEEEQLNFLSALLDCNEYIETMEILQRDAYRHQDLAEILYLATSGWHDAEEECVQALGDSEILTELERVILRISTILADGGAFIALSARILPGERGLLSRLAEQGYQIRRVY